MLTTEDFEGIGRVMEQKIQALVPPMIKASIDELETRMDLKFDAVHEQIEEIREQMVTKDYLNERLEHYVPRPNLA